MKIDRIKEIKNVGVFRNLSAGQFQLDKFCVIFGLNSFGKTTLTNIFQSLKDNNPDLIKTKNSIPIIGSQSQKIDISFNVNSNNQSVVFSSSCWQNSNVGDSIEIFGTEFVYRNLFTGNRIERENKENFTDFILGDSGVSIAKEIELKKIEMNEKSRNLKNILPVEYQKEDFLGLKFKNKDISDINEVDKNEINDYILKLENLKKNKEDSLKNPTIIQELKIPNKITINEEIIENFDKFNRLLQSEYGNIKENFLEKFQAHISDNFKDQNIAGNWIKTGFDNLKNKEGNCIFCSQSLNDVTDIIELYDNFFDAEYKKFVDNINKQFSVLGQYFENFNFINNFTLQSIYENFYKFSKYLDDTSEFHQRLIDLQGKINDFEIKELEIKFQKIKTTIDLYMENKIKIPYQKHKTIDFSDISSALNRYFDCLKKINTTIDDLIEDVNLLKHSYGNVSGIEAEIVIIAGKINQGKRLQLRIGLNEKIISYREEKRKISNLKIEINNLGIELKNNQTQYLEKYFEKINELFKKFGGRNFQLQKTESNRGNKPVYFLELLFHSKQISDNEIMNIFSESDRRALALSIFWAKIELMEETQKKNLIIIMDDPITSFDDNRTANFINYINQQLSHVSQIIILVHYSKFLHDYYIFTENKPSVLELQPGGNIGRMNIDYFLKSDYMKLYDKIKEFIDGGERIEFGNLRNFVEKLYKPIFSDILGEEKINKIQGKCNSYNHNPLLASSDVENFRNFVSELFTEMYTF